MRIFVKYVEIIGLFVHYIYLHIRLVQLHIQYYLLKAAGAALIEFVKIEYCIKSLSNNERVTFAACIAISIYLLALIMFFAFGQDVTVWT